MYRLADDCRNNEMPELNIPTLKKYHCFYNLQLLHTVRQIIFSPSPSWDKKLAYPGTVFDCVDVAIEHRV